jgi:CRISPR-associated exonuclease Cas4
VTDDVFWITPSDVLEFLFCPRFIYFMKVLHVPQFEEKRFLVQKGRKVHEDRISANKSYMRKKLDVERKIENAKLFCSAFRISGIVDEILFLRDGTASPVDYKYAFHKRDFKTYFFQGLMYCLMIEETFRIVSRKAYISFSRDKWQVEEMIYDDSSIEKLGKILESIIGIVSLGLLPKKKGSKRKCADCTFRKLCV